MFGFPKYRPPRVVVEHDQLGTPPKRYGEARIEADADSHLQGLRPRLRRPEQRIGPGLRPQGNGGQPSCHALLPALSASGYRSDIEATVRFAEETYADKVFEQHLAR